MQIRRIQPSDRDEWLRMRRALWPDDHTKEIDDYFAADERPFEVIVLDTGEGLCGFQEVASRSYAEGCSSSPVAYLEGIWIDPEYRRRGLALKLIAAAEEWAREQGLTEIASDCELDNNASIAMHLSSGYQEEVRAICYRKTLSDE